MVLGDLDIKADIAQLKKEIMEAEFAIEKAESAGIDMTEEKAELAEDKENLKKLEAVYG
ncbi:MAG: hypothetical protein ACTSPV_14310 [Candidatus Hodarchaeales archaeon]